MSVRPTTKKTLVAELGGDRDEGLTPTSEKKQENTIMTRPLTPAKWCAAKKERDRIDLYELSRGTVRDLFIAAERTGMDPSDLLQMIEEDQL